MTTVAVATLGCKVNQFESEALMEALEQREYALIPFEEGADVVIINTCTVTHRADFQSRQMVRRALRSNPNSLIIVTGCYPQVKPDAFLEMKAELYLLGNKEKNQNPDLLPLMQKGDSKGSSWGYSEGGALFRDPSSFFSPSHPCLPENSGRLRCLLYLLYCPPCQGSIEEPPARKGG